MLTSVIIIIVISIILFILTILHFWKGNYYRNNKFKILLTVITTFTSIMFSAAIIVQVLSYHNQKTNEEIDRYNSLSKIFLDDILEIFMDHPEVNYYYNELVGIQEIDKNTKRNYVLENQFLSRTKTPIFSFLTDIKDVLCGHNFPFSTGSVFDFVNNNDGTIVFYGAEISSCTFLHYVENQFGPPVFRYDKKFIGSISDGQTISNTFVEFHARPLGLELDYNWDLLLKLLE